jgi:AraC-like DNA-binding protein
MRISSLEAPKWTLQNATVGALRLQQGYEGGGTIAEWATVSDGWTLFHRQYPVRINGQVVTENDFYVVPPGGEFCLASHRSHEWLTVVIPTSLLFQVSPELEFASRARPHLVKPPRHVARRFTSLVRRFFSAAEHRPQLMGSPAALESLQSELLMAARDLFTRGQHSASRQFVRWHYQTKLTEELALSHPDQLLSIAELSRQIGTPERTLRTAFQRCYGLATVEYLRILRLHQARRLLLAGCPDLTTVTRIAFGLGFWELGRFAGAYRQLFGELPSETLRKPARVSVDVRPK